MVADSENSVGPHWLYFGPGFLAQAEDLDHYDPLRDYFSGGGPGGPRPRLTAGV